jgi:hypothetical protein
MQADVVARRNLGGSVPNPLGRQGQPREGGRESAEALVLVAEDESKFPESRRRRVLKQNYKQLRKALCIDEWRQ